MATFLCVTPQRTGIAIAVTAIALAACSNGTTGGDAIPIPGAPAAAASGSDDAVAIDDATTTTASTTADATTPTSTDVPADSSTTSSTTSTTSTTTTTAAPETTTTTTVPALNVFEPACVVEVQPGDSLGLIVEEFDDETINIATVRAENGIDSDTIYPTQLLDICVDNGLDDITGSERTERNAAVAAAETSAAVIAQQEKLNELLTPFGMRELLVDGVSGPVTRRHLCAARLGLGLDVTLTDMEPGSDEEQALMDATSIVAPFTSALNQDRWILIDRTCQVMFVGEGAETLNFVFPTSTGSDGFETRDQDQTRVFRYDPALQNNGWHNSSTYPVPVDNPLNGNMYRPLYFDGGQAIHGANNVPTTPQSKGCARLSPSNQDRLVSWLGLQDASGPQGSIPVTVNVQGEYPDSETPDAVTPGNATDDT